MYAKTTILAALLAAAPMAHADESIVTSSESVAELARDSGLTERNVRMILGARTPYAEYRCCYSRIVRQFKQAVGEETYHRLANGGYVPKAEPRVAARVDEDKDAAPRIEVSAL